MTQRKVVLGLVATFAGAALLFASVGIYGVKAYIVATRRREIGIRLALGAVPSMVIRHVIANGLRPLVIGIVLGIAGALAAARLIASELYGVAAHDPAVLSGTVLTLLATALLACWIPAWRATSADPVSALRSE